MQSHSPPPPHMDENPVEQETNEAIARDAPQLASLLKEMKSVLDVVAAKAQALTQKVKHNEHLTGDGMSYLEAKHLLLLGYCQSIVYYLLRKAKGLPVSGHPVLRTLVETRLFLEKIRPIDKKLEYQIQKVTRAATAAADEYRNKDEESRLDEEDPLKYKPNPDMLVSKIDETQLQEGGVYRPPKFAPAEMDEDRMTKEEKRALRREKQVLREARQSTYLKELLDEVEGRPEEIRETFGSETRELKRYKAKLEERARREEELFARAPITKREKKLEKRLLKSRYGLQGLTDDFFDEIRTLPVEDNNKAEMPSTFNPRIGKKSHSSKRKR